MGAGRAASHDLAPILRRIPTVLSLCDELVWTRVAGFVTTAFAGRPRWGEPPVAVGNDEVGMQGAQEGSRLRKIEVIVGPAKLDSVRLAVLDSGVVHGMTVEEIRDLTPGNQEESPFPVLVIAPRLRIEVAVDADWAEAVVQAICRAADTRRGQGEDRIVVLAMEDAIRIRTGERGAGVL
jgi:nitrogen regulatory protein P-II 1